MKQSLLVIVSLAIIVVSMLGIADAGYLTYEKLSGKLPVCGQGFDCGKVLNSPWAYVGPVPLSALGLVFYLSVFALAIAQYLQVDISQQLQKTGLAKYLKPLNWLLEWQPHHYLMAITSLGFAFSGYLLFLMAVIIQGWCLYCLISAATSITLFILAVLLNVVYTFAGE